MELRRSISLLRSLERSEHHGRKRIDRVCVRFAAVGQEAHPCLAGGVVYGLHAVQQAVGAFDGAFHHIARLDGHKLVVIVVVAAALELEAAVENIQEFVHHTGFKKTVR